MERAASERLPAGDDPVVQKLLELFRSHPAWGAAARGIADGSSSRVYFRHRPGEPWRLVRRGGASLLEPGAADDPDLAFCFPAAAIDALSATRGGVADFALALFRLILEEDPARQVGFRVVAPFTRLARRGYVDLLVRGGPRLLWFGAKHGVRSLAALRRLVDDARRSRPQPWEADAETATPLE